MAPGDYRVYAYDAEKGYILVVSSILTMGYTWPDTIQFNCVTYSFASNEVMQHWMVGNYGGHAKYVEKTTS